MKKKEKIMNNVHCMMYAPCTLNNFMKKTMNLLFENLPKEIIEFYLTWLKRFIFIRCKNFINICYQNLSLKKLICLNRKYTKYKSQQKLIQGDSNVIFGTLI